MSIELNTVLYPVKDLDKAKATFTALFGVEPHVDSKYYVGYEVDGHEIGLVPNGHVQGMTGPEPVLRRRRYQRHARRTPGRWRRAVARAH